MDDPDMEWEIQEYSSPSKEGEITKVRWILNKGLWLGKKVVITGIAISSAPLVLPPLVVFSALGFAFSVPFGLVFASYACTDKLMSKLLPTPAPPSTLEYYTDEDEEEEKEGFGRFAMEEEEEEQMEDIRRGVERRIELDEDDYWRQDVGYYEEPLTAYVDEYVEEEDYEEDVVEYAKAEDTCAEEVDKDIEVRDENVEEDGYGEDVGEYVEDEDDYEKENEAREEGEWEKSVSKESEHVGEEETIDNGEEVIARGSTGLLEKIRNEGNIGYDVTEETYGAKGTHGVGEGEGGKNVSIIGPIEESFGEKERDVTVSVENERAVEATKSPLEEDVKPEKPNEKIGKEGIVPSKVEQVGEADDTALGNGKTIPDMNGTLNAKSFGGNVDTISKEQEPVISKKVVVQEERATYNTSTDASEDITSKKIRENIIYSDANIREIADESGFDLFDDRNVASYQNSYTAFQSLEAYDKKDNTAEVNVDYLALPTSGRVSESNKATIPMQADKAPSSEVLLKEAKIWEQIDAMRAIVGYKAAPQRTCIEELEALYIFTGVEPRASFKDPSDIADVNHKLRFLMSIVGVK